MKETMDSHDFESVRDILRRMMTADPAFQWLSGSSRAYLSRQTLKEENGHMSVSLNDTVESLRILDELIDLLPAEEGIKVWRHVALSRINPAYLQSPDAYIPRWETRKNS